MIGKKFLTCKNSTITVINKCVENKTKNSLYEVHCSSCSNDTELFPEVLSVWRPSLNKGKFPCGCSKSPKWSEHQRMILVKRKCDELGYDFLGWGGEFNGKDTKLLLRCKCGFSWGTTTIHNLLRGLSTCKNCSAKKSSKRLSKPEHVVLEQIKGICGEECLLFVGWAGEYKNEHSKFKWVCEEGHSCSTSISNFLLGRRCPSCAGNNQKQLYINIVSNKELPLGLKYGIAFDYRRREREENRVSLFNIKTCKVYLFSTVEDCKEAEKYIKRYYKLPYFTKQEVPDGYTETASIFEMERIITICEEFGGTEKRLT